MEENQVKTNGRSISTGGIVGIVIAFIVVAGIAVFYMLSWQKSQQNIEEMTQLFEIEKEEMENEYSESPFSMMR